MNPNPELFDYQLKAIRDIQENGLPVGRTNVLCSLLGRTELSGKSNQLFYYINALPKEERDKLLASIRIVGPMHDAFESGERMEEIMRLAEERIQRSMTVMVRPDLHVAISGGGRVPPRPSDLRAALDGRSIHIEYDSCGGLRAKNAAECAERPNTTDMFRMFRDNHNKPKRGKK